MAGLQSLEQGGIQSSPYLEGKDGQNEGIAGMVGQGIGAAQPKALQGGQGPVAQARPVQLALPALGRALLRLPLQ